MDVNNPPQSPKGGSRRGREKRLDGYEPHKTNPKRKRDGKYHTPEHSGEVEGPHRIDQGKFYRFLTFYSLEDLRLQGARWNAKYNKTPRMTLKMKPPTKPNLKSSRSRCKIPGRSGAPSCLNVSDHFRTNTRLFTPTPYSLKNARRVITYFS